MMIHATEAQHKAVKSNYKYERHLLQNTFVPMTPPPGGEFYFMKIHKAGSTTVIATLTAHLYQLAGVAPRQSSQADLHKRPPPVFAARRKIGPDLLIDRLFDPDVYKFTFLRDPVSRLVSAWADKLVSSDLHLKRLNKYLDRPLDQEISLDAFIDLCTNDQGARELDHHWRPQVLEGAFNAVNYDFIGDVSRLRQSLAVVTSQLFGTDQPMLEDTRKSLGHKTSARELVAGLSMSQIDRIEMTYAEDVELYAEVCHTLDGLL